MGNVGWSIWKSREGSLWTRLRKARLSKVSTRAFETDQMLFAGTADGKVFRSTDGGSTWEEFNLTHYRPIWALGISPAFAPDRTVLAGTDEGTVFRSTGGRWESVSEGLAGSAV